MAVGNSGPVAMLDPVQDDDFFALMDGDEAAAVEHTASTTPANAPPHRSAPASSRAQMAIITEPIVGHALPTVGQPRASSAASAPASARQPVAASRVSGASPAARAAASPATLLTTAASPGPSSGTAARAGEGQQHTPLARSDALREAARESPTSPSVLSSRRFPGPAGALPPLNIAQLSSQMEPRKTPKQPQRAAQREVEDQGDFSTAGWLAMCAALGVHTSETCILGANIGTVRRGVSTKIANLVVIVKQIKSSESDASVVLKDRTGEVRGTIHHRAVEMFAPDELSVGTVLVLRQVSVFAPSPRSCHLNITPDNISQLFTAGGACVVPAPRAAGRPRPGEQAGPGSAEPPDMAPLADNDLPLHPAPSPSPRASFMSASAAAHEPRTPAGPRAPRPAPPLSREQSAPQSAAVAGNADGVSSPHHAYVPTRTGVTPAVGYPTPLPQARPVALPDAAGARPSSSTAEATSSVAQAQASSAEDGFEDDDDFGWLLSKLDDDDEDGDDAGASEQPNKIART